MATVATPPPPPIIDGHKLKFPAPPLKPLPQSLIESSRIPAVPFNADKHVQFEFPQKCYTMTDIGKQGAGISDHAISEPFPLFTHDAIRQFRREIFSEGVLSKYQCGSPMATNMIRGYCPREAPFIFDAWNSPKVLESLSRIAGIDLVPVIDIDIGHCNITIKGDDERDDVLAEENDDSMSAFGWHYDSYAFVCVIMLSDCTGMVGGETAIRCGNGDIFKARGPTMGTAVLMQGRYIEHQALKAHGGRERISMVTSFRPKSPWIRDEALVSTLRGISPATELFYQYAEYRLQNLEARVRDQLREMRKRKESGREFNWEAGRWFLTEQRKFLDGLLEELEACAKI
ncbi:hypothetical protein S7711_08954 [Stachybotrys chartarum IBT 7711]|uniref:Fe2OG dioxygenase domain-containing protein n=1 Tax=Stachybotrys chartarum (strain CBS 109288 / IBT 7711) TaxID=1280523 RepID=A0A084AYI7_STACB|nr:hypothetical protein S7711_08954 [Stachybotrys chartarum IBT 7711]KFA47694.1 hypothetical protein S40293_08721 [Stachybotrys chartarum IBT 40293]KFA77660.1 hypothetical protein S40288_02738 [Stachybotrys chartarum IBT 40288]